MQVARILRVLSGGSSFSALIETSHGTRAVLKLRASGGGVRDLLGELVVGLLAPLLRLPVPAARPIDLPRDMPWSQGTDEFDAVIRASAGDNLAVDFIEGAVPLRPKALDGLPQEFLAALAWLDAAFVNFDRTLMNPNILIDARGNAFATDHGACRFLEAPSEEPPALPAGHMLRVRADLAARAALRPFRPPALDVDAIEAVARAVPVSWLSPEWTHESLAARIARRLGLPA